MTSDQVKWWKMVFAELVDDDGTIELRIPCGGDDKGVYVGKAILTDVKISYTGIEKLVRGELE